MAETLAETDTVLSTLRVNFPTAEIREVDERTLLVMEADGLHEVLTSMKTDGSYTLVDVTGVNLSALTGEAAPLQIAYQLRPVRAPFVCLQLSADFDPEETALASVTDLFPGIDWQEREVAEMFGVRFTGRSTTRALILHSLSSVHPLRKSYPLLGEGETGKPEPTGVDTAALVAPIPTLRMRPEVVAGRRDSLYSGRHLALMLVAERVHLIAASAFVVTLYQGCGKFPDSWATGKCHMYRPSQRSSRPPLPSCCFSGSVRACRRWYSSAQPPPAGNTCCRWLLPICC